MIQHHSFILDKSSISAMKIGTRMFNDGTKLDISHIFIRCDQRIESFTKIDLFDQRKIQQLLMGYRQVFVRTNTFGNKYRRIKMSSVLKIARFIIKKFRFCQRKDKTVIACVAQTKSKDRFFSSVRNSSSEQVSPKDALMYV